MKNRQLKFRVWDNLKKEWVQNKGIWRITTNENGIGGIAPPISFRQHPEGHTIQQWTGLIDKNNVEIYEGDIINGHYFGFNGNETDNTFENAVVMYSDWAQYGIQIEDGWLDFDQTSHFDEPCLEVIGNILENPELVKSL